jgi:AraC-like DNA-binding protein
MFIMQQDYSYNIDILKQTHLITCILHTEIFFAEQLLINQLLPLCKIHPEILTKLTINKTINDFLILIHDYIDDGIQSYSFYESKRNEFLFVLSTYYSRLDLAQFLYFIIYENIQFKEFIMNHYLQVKNVQELAALANYSTSGFIKKFQRCFNQSPYGWMQKQKAKQIAVDIKQGIKSLQEIAVEYKFSSYQHFSSFCKKQMGFPPTELLK